MKIYIMTFVSTDKSHNVNFHFTDKSHNVNFIIKKLKIVFKNL